MDVELFALLAETIGSQRISIQTTSPWTARELLAHLAKQYPQAAELIRLSRVAINHSYASPDAIIASGSAVAIIPPVSGG